MAIQRFSYVLIATLVVLAGLNHSDALAQVGPMAGGGMAGMMGGSGVWSVLSVLLIVAIIGVLVAATIYLIRQSARPRR